MRRRSRRTKKTKKVSIRINIKKLIFPFIVVGILVYVIFALLSLKEINTSNPISENNSHLYLLSQKKDSLNKTLLVFESRVDNQDRIENVYVFVQNEEKKEGVLIYVPSWLYYAGLENDFGNAVPVSSFRYAGEFLQQGRGVEYTVWQLEQLLGINFDNYIWFPPEVMSVVRENLGEVSNSMMYSSYYKNSREVTEESLYLNGFLSNLSWFKLITNVSKFNDSSAVIYSDMGSLIRVLLNLKDIQQNIASNRPYLLNSGSPTNIESIQAVNSAGIMNYLNIPNYDEQWRELSSKLLDKALEQERVRVEVYNGSGTVGAAGELARKIENAGCDVVRYDNAPEAIDNTIFYIPNPEDYKNSLEVISELIPGQYEMITGRPSFMTTGDIVIILGKDISRMYSF